MERWTVWKMVQAHIPMYLLLTCTLHISVWQNYFVLSIPSNPLSLQFSFDNRPYFYNYISSITALLHKTTFLSTVKQLYILQTAAAFLKYNSINSKQHKFSSDCSFTFHSFLRTIADLGTPHNSFLLITAFLSTEFNWSIPLNEQYNLATNSSFPFHNSSFPSHNSSFPLLNSSFSSRTSSFHLLNSSFPTHNNSFPSPNRSFSSHNNSFPSHNC